MQGDSALAKSLNLLLVPRTISPKQIPKAVLNKQANRIKLRGSESDCREEPREGSLQLRSVSRQEQKSGLLQSSPLMCARREMFEAHQRFEARRKDRSGEKRKSQVQDKDKEYKGDKDKRNKDKVYVKVKEEPGEEKRKSQVQDKDKEYKGDKDKSDKDKEYVKVKEEQNDDREPDEWHPVTGDRRSWHSRSPRRGIASRSPTPEGVSQTADFDGHSRRHLPAREPRTPTRADFHVRNQGSAHRTGDFAHPRRMDNACWAEAKKQWKSTTPLPFIKQWLHGPDPSFAHGRGSTPVAVGDARIEHSPERASGSGGAYTSLAGLPGAAKSKPARGSRLNSSSPAPSLPGSPRSRSPSPGPPWKKKKKAPLHPSLFTKSRRKHQSRFSHSSTSSSEAGGDIGTLSHRPNLNFATEGPPPTDTCGTSSDRWPLGYSACPSRADSQYIENEYQKKLQEGRLSWTVVFHEPFGTEICKEMELPTGKRFVNVHPRRSWAKLERIAKFCFTLQGRLEALLRFDEARQEEEARQDLLAVVSSLNSRDMAHLHYTLARRTTAKFFTNEDGHSDMEWVLELGPPKDFQLIDFDKVGMTMLTKALKVLEKWPIDGKLRFQRLWNADDEQQAVKDATRTLLSMDLDLGNEKESQERSRGCRVK